MSCDSPDNYWLEKVEKKILVISKQYVICMMVKALTAPVWDSGSC